MANKTQKDKYDKIREKCPDCGVGIGELHKPYCDVERCPACGGQYLSCCCAEEELRGLSRIPWKGTWPGISECQGYGLYARRIPGVPGWQPCSHDDAGATEDLNRLMEKGRWDKTQQKWVIPGPQKN